MQWQIDLLSSLSDLSLPGFHSLFYFIIIFYFLLFRAFTQLFFQITPPELFLEYFHPFLKQSPPVRGSNRLRLSYILSFFFNVTRFSTKHPTNQPSLSAETLNHFALHVSFFFFSVSVWLVVWNIERCLFLLWLPRQGAQWQTTRDRIDYAACL